MLAEGANIVEGNEHGPLQQANIDPHPDFRWRKRAVFVFILAVLALTFIGIDGRTTIIMPQQFSFFLVAFASSLGLPYPNIGQSTSPIGNAPRFRRENRSSKFKQNVEDIQMRTVSPPWKFENPVVWRYRFPGNLSFEVNQVPLDQSESFGRRYTEWNRLRWNVTASAIGNQSLKHKIAKGKDLRNIKHIWIWGERNSCTTAITRSLLKNFDLDCQDPQKNGQSPLEVLDCVIGGLPWKHDFMRRADLSHQGDVLNILVTRHPYEWLDSMHRIGFGADFHRVHNMSTFLSLEWVALNDEDPLLSTYIQQHPPSITSVGNVTWRPRQPETKNASGTSANPITRIPPHCLTSKRAEIFEAGACVHHDVRYICTPLPGKPNWRQKDDSPMNGCFSGRYSHDACPHGMWLCEHHHRFLDLLDPTVLRNAVLDSNPTLGRRAMNHFQLARKRWFQTRPALLVSSLRLAQHAVEDIMRGDDFAEALGRMQILKPVDEAFDAALLQAQDDAQAGDQDEVAHLPARFSEEGWVYKGLAPCVTDVEPRSPLVNGSSCVYNGKLHSCIAVPGLEVSSGNEPAPSRHCCDGDRSWDMCTGGRFLCAVGSQHPWTVDLDAWRMWLGVAWSTMAGSANSSSWVARLSHMRGVYDLMSDRDPETGERFPTVLAMREAKLRDWLRVEPSLDFSSHISCRDFLLDASEVLDGLRRAFLLKKKETLSDGEWALTGCIWTHGKCTEELKNHQARRVKGRYYLSGKHMNSFTELDLKIANAWLDPDLESRFQYRLFENLSDASRPYTSVNRCRQHGVCDRGDAVLLPKQSS